MAPACGSGLIGLTRTLSLELGEAAVRVNTILPGAVEGTRIQHVFEGRARVSGKSLDEVAAEAFSRSRSSSIPKTLRYLPSFWHPIVRVRSPARQSPSTATHSERDSLGPVRVKSRRDA